MAIDFNTVAEQVFDQLKGYGHSIVMFDKNNKETRNAKEGRTFYSKDQKFGVEIDEAGDGAIKVKYGESSDPNKVKKLVDSVRSGIAKKYLIGKVDFMPYTGKDIELKDIHNLVKESLAPAAGSLKTSYQQTDGAKLIIRHSKPVNEEVRGSRSRNISALFIENAQGERFRYPHIHLAGARVMTRHVAEGGTPYDEVGQKIISLSEERANLIKVNSYIKHNGLQEQAGDVGYAVTQRLSEIKNLLKTYRAESLLADAYESDDSSIEQLKEKLTKNVFDESIGGMLPKIGGYLKAYQNKIQAEQALSAVQHQVAESAEIAVTEMPDLDQASMIVYESPTVNTTELINLVLPVLEDQKLKTQLEQVSSYVGEGLLDPAVVDNLTRSIVAKSVVNYTPRNDVTPDVVFESLIKKRFDIREILK